MEMKSTYHTNAIYKLFLHFGTISDRRHHHRGRVKVLQLVCLFIPKVIGPISWNVYTRPDVHMTRSESEFYEVISCFSFEGFSW